MLVITELGRAAIVDAQSQGLKLSITGFAIGNGTNGSHTPLLTGLIGTQLYPTTLGTTAYVTNVEAVSSSTIQFTCEVPDSVPAPNTSWTMSELGLYTDTGVLFAIGPISPYAIKYNGVIYRAISSLTVSNCDDYSVNINTHMSLPYVAHLTSLESPVRTVENAVIVGDGKKNDAHTDTSPSATIATRYGGSAEISEWAFSGYTRILHSINPVVLSDTSFKLNELDDDAKIWLYDQETVLVQVIAGDSIGQTRKFKYNTDAPPSTNGNFTLDGTDALYNFSDIDKINIWRSDANQLPNVIDVEDGKTLQIFNGRPIWGTSGGSYDLSSYLYPFKLVRFMFDGDTEKKTFDLPISDVCYSIIGISGAIQDQSAYGIVGTKLLFTSAPCTGRHEALLFVADTAKSNNGAEVIISSEQYITGDPAFNAGNSELTLVDGPADANDLLVFHAHMYRTQEEYSYEPVSKVITFPESLIDGITEVRWFNFNETETGSIVSVSKLGFMGDGKTTYSVPAELETSNSFTFSQGGYNETGRFTIDGGVLDMGGSTIIGRPIEVISFINSVPNFSAMILRGDSHTPALNSTLCPLKDGDLRTMASVPQMYMGGTWRTLSEVQNAHVVSEEGDGVSTSFEIDVVPRAKEHVRVNVAGTILMLSEYNISGSTLTLTLDDPLPVGRKIEILISSYWIFSS